MTTILWAVGIVAGLALGCGLMLAIASMVMAVPTDEKTEAIRAVLPGANCGACGYSGCEGYAAALASGEAKNGLCSPGGQGVSEAVAALIGGDATLVRQIAYVRCGGCEEFTSKKHAYQGIPSCAAATQLFGGDQQCDYGCLGYGDCQKACEYGAITIENGLAIIDPDLCVGCSMCVAQCPKKLIAMFEVPTEKPVPAVVACMNQDKGAATRAICEVGCIGCMRCVKACEYDAITVKNFLATVDPKACTGCYKCVGVCPTKCMRVLIPGTVVQEA